MAITAVSCSLQSFVRCDPRDLVLGPNATTLLNAVVLGAGHSTASSSKSRAEAAPLLRPGDHVLLLDTAYGGVKKLCAEACRRVGATLEVVPLPLPLPAASETAAASNNGGAASSSEAAAVCVETVAARVRRGRTALVVLDHTTSNTALTMPVRGHAGRRRALAMHPLPKDCFT